MQTLTRRQSEVPPSFCVAILGGRSGGQSSALEAQHEPTVRVVAELRLARRKLEFADTPRSTLTPTIQAFARVERRLDRPLRFAIMGEFNSGKSSLVNLLANVECLPTAVVSNTRVPTLLYDASEPEIWAVHENGKRERLRADRGAPSPSVFRLEVGVPSQRLRAVQLLDLPGLADARSRPSGIDLSLHGVDAVVWCTVSTQAWKESERIAWSHLPARLRGRGLLVSTHVDLLHDVRDAEKVLTRLRSAAGPLFRDIVLVSTLDALALLRDEGAGSAEAAWSATGAGALDAALCRLLREVREQRTAAAIKMTCRLVDRARSQFEGRWLRAPGLPTRTALGGRS